MKYSWPTSLSLQGLPEFRLLSSHGYHVLAHARGSCFSRFRHWALNDWVRDGLQDYGGVQVYLRDEDSGELHHLDLGLAPSAVEQWEHSDAGAAWDFRLGDLQFRVSLSLSTQCPMEIRTMDLMSPATSDHSTRRLSLTVFVPIALNAPAAHESHPAFSKLFVQTRFCEANERLIAQRRPRGAGEVSPCVMATFEGPGELHWETDRIRFIGRGSSIANPAGLRDRLSKSADNVLDACFVLQRSFHLKSGESARFHWTMAAAEDIDSLNAYPKQSVAKVENRASDLKLDSLLGAMFCRSPRLKPPASYWKDLYAEPGNVWGYGMPTESPFVLLLTDLQAEIEWAASSKRYWAEHGIEIPVLVVWYGAENSICEMQRDVGKGLAFRGAATVPTRDLQALVAASAAVCGTRAPACAPPFRSAAPHAALQVVPPCASTLPEKSQNLQLSNSYGGFSEDGREYVIHITTEVSRSRLPPMPWINVLANPIFGALVSETGAGCSWSGNSHQRRLTPWANDPVRDRHEEALYLHDENTGTTWSPLPGPLPVEGETETRHGFGYTTFSRFCADLHQQVQVFVHLEKPVKIWRITLRNSLNRERNLRLTSLQRLVLGFLPQHASGGLLVWQATSGRTLFARNPLGGAFKQRVAFASVVGDGVWRGSGNRRMLLGDEGDLSKPVGMLAPWEGDPAIGDAAFLQQLSLTLPANGELSLSVLLGDAADEAEAAQFVLSLKTDTEIFAALTEVKAFWRKQVGVIQVKTPSQEINFMLNGWLLYQTLVCRLWGRTAFYQSSGAYGFRDQLQDCGAFAITHPEITRKQILLHASRQFIEGDVQHWWHEPPLGSGLRTRFSDDLNWLPFITAHYLDVTGDVSVLDEIVPFLTGRLLQEGEDEAFETPQMSGEPGTLYEHCCRALDRSLTRGAHGLPLMGTGDWNDGMNRVGREGRGESVWMGFFLYTILGDFIPLAEKLEDAGRAEQYRDYRRHLLEVLNRAGWDGEWYRRAYYDNGDVLGSSENDECRIDALAQAWAVLSGVASPERAHKAMAATEKYLIDREGGLIRLLTPAFANTKNDPGYIKGYVAGVRENGGQYTHAAAWVVKAMAKLQREDCVAELYEMLLPARHTRTPEGVARFKVEPYVAVADVYGEAPHVGRGGWTWYTGTSGWLYRVGIENVAGFSLIGGDTVGIKPCIPAEWPGFSLRYQLPKGGCLQVEVERQAGSLGSAVLSALLDGVEVILKDGVALACLDGMKDGSILQVVVG
ncbi:Cyclic beta 1-2 glucan synthetase [gamma proteobacterium HdN1]|nr:Cyclic beta 1-2 glucan synthetase [gamma proteobacterium HdN1]